MEGLQWEGLPFAHGEITEVIGAKMGAMQGGDVVALAGKHAPDLMVAALSEGESCGGGAGQSEACGKAGFGLAAQQQAAAGEDGDECGVELPIDGDLIGFFEIRFGRGVTMDEWALIGDEEQTAGFFVEAADAGDHWVAVAPLVGQQFVDVAALILAMGAAVASGFMQHDQQAEGGFERLLIKGDE